MKTMLINASPRKKWNTHQMLMEAEKGAKAAGSETEMIHLYDYIFQGCRSCFACKLKGGRCGLTCVVRDDITDILKRAADADVLIFGSPVYLHGATSQFRAFLERLLFPITSYTVDEQGSRTRILDHTVPTGLIYTMNNTVASIGQKRYDTLLGINGELLEIAYGHNEILYAGNTWQFSDYSRYEANLFDVAQKEKSRKEQFPKDLAAAREMGERLVNQARFLSGGMAP